MNHQRVDILKVLHSWKKTLKHRDHLIDSTVEIASTTGISLPVMEPSRPSINHSLGNGFPYWATRDLPGAFLKKACGNTGFNAVDGALSMALAFGSHQSIAIGVNDLSFNRHRLRVYNRENVHNH
jgi:hypothetical protein